MDLADPGQVDAWIAGWGALLADLGYQPLVTHIAVTVDTSPTGGATVRDHVAAALDPHAPALARHVLEELAAVTPAAAAEVDARLTVTLDPRRAQPQTGRSARRGRRRRPLAARDRDRARRLRGRRVGAGVDRLADRPDPGGVRPGRPPRPDPPRPGQPRRPTTQNTAALLEWAEAGPVAAVENWDSYRHDSGLSVSWALREAPRQAVAARVLAPLLTPGPFPRRVTWLYEPYPADQAAARVEAEVSAGQIRRAWAARTRRDETQRERDDRDRAVQSAREEAEGAGVGRFTAYVTTTVTDPDQLAAAVADLEQRAGQAKLRLRRLRGSQAAGFAAALGVGINPVDAARHRTGR